MLTFKLWLWIYPPLSRYKLFANEKSAAILVFVLGVTLRTIPELIAHPYPIGYDVINYYIPIVENFDEHWATTAGQFPSYVLLLHSAQLVTGLPTQAVVAAIAVAMFGFFGTSIFYLGRSMLKLGVAASIFLAAFVIFQMAVLRTTWDLHRDIFALAAMFFAFSMLARNNGWKGIAMLLALAALVAIADRMIGVLFCISLAVYAVMTRRKDVILTSIFATGLFSILIVASYSASNVSVSSLQISAEKTAAFYDPQNLLILFVVANGLLVAPAAIGFLRMKSHLLKVPLIVAIAGSFSWLAFPDIGQLVADRWVILAGIFLAVFAGYGILHIARYLQPRFSIAIAGSILTIFVIIGLAYAVMPYDSPFILYEAARGSIEDFGPPTMQFNSLDIQDNTKLLSIIEWINQNTEEDAVIVGEKHWRGFMWLYLEDGRTYQFSDDPDVLALAIENKGKPAYKIVLDVSSPSMFTLEDVAIR